MTPQVAEKLEIILAPEQETFLCQGCFDDKSLGDRSRDMRYCHDCYRLINSESRHEKRQAPDYWMDPYIRKDKELQAYATFVTGGKGYRVAKNGQTYCIGTIGTGGTPATNREKSVADSNTDHNDSVSSVVEESEPKIKISKTTANNNTRVNDNNFGSVRGRPKKEVPEYLINKLSQEGSSIREIEKKTGVPYSSIRRVLAGQRVLV